MTVVERAAAPDIAAALTPLVARAAGREEATLISATLPVAPVDPIALHGLARPLGASLWMQPDAGVAHVGIGEAWSARQSHEGRFQVVSLAWRMLLEDALVDTAGAPRGSGPLLLGGFGFDDDPVESELWEGFESGCLTLPALLLSTTSRPSAPIVASRAATPAARSSE